MRSTNLQHIRQPALNAILCGALTAVIAIALPGTLRAQAPAGQAGAQGRGGGVPPGDALFTSAQAIAGKALYQRNCANCHGAMVDDGNAPPLRGAAFLGKYAGKPAADLFTYVSKNMPKGNPGSLGGTEYAQIIAYVLQQSGFATGRKEFASDAAALASVTIPGSQGGAWWRWGRRLGTRREAASGAEEGESTR